jgi:hypothetical protein
VRERWFGATGLRVTEIAIENVEVEVVDESHVRHRDTGDTIHEALIVDDVGNAASLREAHAGGLPVIVRAGDAAEIEAALSRPEVSCALVPRGRADLQKLDLRRLKYG